MGPYKYKFNRNFRSMINASRPFKNVLDAACADAKFRSYFGTSSYTGIDISRERLNSANALINSKGFANTELIEQDLTNPNGLIFTNKFDLVVSNPPYIKNSELLSLDKDVKLNEPKIALSGGFSGLETFFK